MDCKWIYKGKEYNSLQEAYDATRLPNPNYDKLISLITEAGIKIEGIKQYEKKTGKKADFDAMADLAGLVIYTDNINTLPEEFSHFVEAQYVGTPAHNYLLEQVKELPIYQEVVKAYSTKYNNNETLLAREAIGKLMHNVLVKKIEQSPFRRILSKMFNAIRNMFRKSSNLKRWIDENTDRMLEGNIVIEAKDGKLFSLDEKAKDALNKRIKSKDNPQFVKTLLVSLENEPIEKSIPKVLDYIKTEADRALNYLRKSRKDGTLNQMSAERIIDLKNFLDTYRPFLQEIGQHVLEEDSFDTIELNSTFDQVDNYYRALRKKITEDNLTNELASEFGLNVNDADIKDQIINKLGYDYIEALNNEKDLNFLERWVGMPEASSSNIIRFLGSRIENLSSNIRNNSLPKMERVYSILKNINTRNIVELKDGKPTHNFYTGYNLSGFETERNNFIKSLKEKYNLSESESEPSDPKQRIKFKKELNKFAEINQERQFIPEYYERFENLSEETQLVQIDIKDKIDNLIHKYSKDLSKWPKDRIKELNDLRREKANLANLYYENSDKKTGKDLEIAKELKKSYEGLDALYKRSKDKFKNFRSNAIKNKTPEQIKAWDAVNTDIEYDQEFWKELDKIEKTNYGKKYEELNNEKKELLKLFKIDGRTYDVDAIPSVTKDRIKAIEMELDAIRRNTKTEYKSLPFKSFVHPQFEVEKSKNEGNIDWLNENTINGEPLPFWKYIEPKNKKYIKTVPSFFFLENNEDSAFFNPKFDKLFRGIQPSDKWKTENTLSAEEQEALDALMVLKDEIDDSYGLKRNNRIPQILDTTLRRALNRDSNIFKGMISEIQTQEDDIEYSKEKVLLSRYTKKVKDPELLSTDIAGTFAMYVAANEHFKEYQKALPLLELLTDQLQEGSVKTVAEEMLAHHGYSIKEKEVKARILGKDINVSKVATKFLGFVSKLNLSWNPFTIMAGAIQSSTVFGMEVVLGQNFDTKSAKKGMAEFNKNLPEIFTEVGKVNKNNRLIKKMQQFGLLADDANFFKNTDFGRLGKTLNDNFFFGGYKLVDFQIKGVAMTTSLLNLRKIDGRFLTKKQFLREGYTLDQYNNAPTAYDSDLSLNEIAIINRRIKATVKRIDGQLSEEDKAQIHRSILGKMVTMHRGWLIDGVTKRIKKRGYNYSLGEIDEGYYRTTWNFLYNTVLSKERVNSISEAVSRWNELSDIEKMNVRRSILEISVGYVVMYLAVGLNSIADDEDDYLLDSLAYLSNRVTLELNSLNAAAPLLVTKEITSTFKDPFIPLRSINNVTNLGNDLFIGLLDPEDEITQGIYKGMSREERALIRLTPILKSIQQARQPAAANQWLKSQPLDILY